MKSITNDSLQTFEIYLSWPKGVSSVRLRPKHSIVVPASAITEQCKVLFRRKLIKIREA